MVLVPSQTLLLLTSFVVISSLTTTIFGLVTKQQELDKISSLPGQPPVTFSQFSGYVTVNEKHGRALFYWLTEASVAPETKPLVLWLNGGPGCSSVAYGASEEIGAFKINKTGSSLYLNKFAWNRENGIIQPVSRASISNVKPKFDRKQNLQQVESYVKGFLVIARIWSNGLMETAPFYMLTEANILFLESPAGVGFSYTNTTSDLTDSGDKRTAKDALVFLIRWMSRFPQYKHRDFYIAGESYAGHYVPQLAREIYHHNKSSKHPIINLKGFIVGNAVTDDYYDTIGTVTYWWTHSMISDATYRSILHNCNFKSESTSKKCDEAVNYAIYHEFGKIDQYSLYTPACLQLANSSSNNVTELIRLKNTLLRRRVSGYDPCTENYAEKYYNRPDVQKALHANVTGIPYKWTACSDILIKTWKDSEDSMLPTYKELIAAGLRIWVFSGDTDSVVPVTATRFALSHLNLPVKTRWYPWYSGSQVGGWTEVYDGLTFATVRGAGHEVPVFRPRQAFILFRSFLAGKELPRS